MRLPSTQSRTAISLDPAIRLKIERALEANAIAKAAALAGHALRRGMIDPLLLNLAAWEREEAGDFRGAHRLLQRALALVPGDPLVLGAIGSALRKEGLLDEAIAVLDQAISAAPLHAANWLERGYALDARRSWAEARASYTQALALDPLLAPALGKLAENAAKDGDAATARALAHRALAVQPKEPNAVCALATIEIEARDGASAEARLRELLKSGVKGDDKTRALTLLGDALDRQDHTAAAFATYQRAQRNFRSIYARELSPSVDRPSHRRFIETITDQLRVAPISGPADPGPIDPRAATTHVFLLGYPRSGTTLVENVLASAPGVIALEERETLADTDDVLVANDGTMPALDMLSTATLAAMRSGYWQRVTDMAGSVQGSTFIDMNPFNGIKLPIIARLFPDAKILIMRRDPRDIILSCFRINFTPSTAAWAFSDLDEAARHYDALMRLVDLSLQRLPLAFQDVRYDRLVTNFETTIRDVAAFIGLDWTDAFLSFESTAIRRGVRTASASQVRQGLFDGRGQWRRYADQLEPILPILKPWIEHLGFEY